MDTITLPTAADMHIHLRQGSLMTMVTPAVAEGGVSICYVMVGALPPPFPAPQAHRLDGVN